VVPTPISILETFGLRPIGDAVAAARRIIAGDPYIPKTRLGLSSVRIFKPQISFATWLGRTRADRLVPIYNFVNRVPQPKDEGYSVRVTTARDFRGGRWTYDGHLGTDFACPVGTTIVAGAPGWVVRVANELDRGGLKVCVDHGDGLFTTHNHLSRALVAVGDRVARGQPLGLSGASGLEFVFFFPWISPHLHYNVWLDGEVCDPFARPDETSLWRRRNEPVPHDGTTVRDDASLAPTPWDRDAVDAAIETCRDPALRDYTRSLPTVAQRAAEVMVHWMYRPTLFTAAPKLCRERFGPRPRLDLPFRRDDFVGAWLPA
jgi:murein DD-endopeptidase MepM/ murein hydrolase activator NlpD